MNITFKTVLPRKVLYFRLIQIHDTLEKASLGERG
jgi:hypothetical protein